MATPVTRADGASRSWVVLPVMTGRGIFGAAHLTVLPQNPVAEKTVRRRSVVVELAEDHVVVTARR